ncbi:site-specific integrase [Bacillus sp. M6-12]|nr:site-specific integrase [Bacillus sp. M6-12]
MIKQHNFQTAGTYESYINHRIIPALGHTVLSSLTPILLQNYVNELHDEGLAGSTITKIYNIMKSSLDYAVNMELLPSNPIKTIQLPSVKKKKDNVWEVAEMKTFLNTAKQDRFYLAFHLTIMTGMWRGEILGLRWRDVDLEKGVLYVRQTLSKDGKQFLTGAKTNSGIRGITLPEETLSALQSQKVSIAKEKLKCGPVYLDNDLVVCTTKGTPVNPNNLKRTFLRLVKEAGVAAIRFHDLRHSHVTMLLAKGVHAKVISERLGHSNIKTTLDIYSHVLPSMQEEAANQIDAFAKSN